MQKHLLFLFSIIAAIAVIGFIAAYAPESQSALIILQRDSGPVGSTIWVYGQGFASNRVLDIKFNATVVKNLTTDQDGKFNATGIIIPSAQLGVHTINATEVFSGQWITKPFTVTSSSGGGAGGLTLSPTSGPPNTNVIVSGTGFPASTPISLKFDSVPISPTSTITSDSAGSFTGTFVIPLGKAVGSYTVEATGGSTTKIASFAVTAGAGPAAITLSPVSGAVTTSVTVTGTGFGPGSTITLKLGTTTLTTTNPPTITATSTGTFQASFLIPDLTPAGSQTITATDATGKTASKPFTVVIAGKLTVTPTSGVSSTEITLRGENFAFNNEVFIKFDNQNVTDPRPDPVITGMEGKFLVKFYVPSGLGGGTYTITATDRSGRIGATTFTIEGPGLGPSITLSSTSVTIGSTVTVTGTNFPANSPVSIKLDGTTLITAPSGITTLSTGSFSAQVTVASVSSGSHTISATAGGRTASATLSVSGGGAPAKVEVSQVKLVDSTGGTVSTPSLGSQVLIQSRVKNDLTTDQDFAYIVQLKNSGGTPIMISWMTGVLPANKEFAVAQSWLVTEEDSYTAEVFVWESVSNPVVLGPMQKINFTVR